MTDLYTSPKEVKRAITQRIRGALTMMGSLTKAELCQRLGISFPTISKFLHQMEVDGEIFYKGDDDSSGGRRAKRYAYNPEYMSGLALFVEKTEINYAVFNSFGEIKEQGTTPNVLQHNVQLLENHVELLIEKYPRIRSIAIGMPGAVKNGRVIFSPPYEQYLNYNFQERFESKFQIPVVVENDMNASVLGYASNFELEEESLVYLYFSPYGPGSGMMINGDVVRGSTFFTGEISFVPLYDDRSFLEALHQGESNQRMDFESAGKIDAIARLIATYAAILNPRAIVFGNDEIDEALLSSIRNKSSNYIPQDHLPLLVTSNLKQDYLSGLQYLSRNLMIMDY
nr:ROK family protein [Paenibacillus aestuarii]